MVLFNHATREMTAKIVYYGPGLCGKTTNLMVIFDKLDPRNRGKMLSLATRTDRTLFFDLLPVDIGKVGSFNLKIQLYTVPGQVFYNETRKLVLKGADAVVFVVDSQPSMVESNRESYQNLMENLTINKLDPEEIPVIVQYNKRDIPGVLPVSQLEQELDLIGFPSVEASALNGDGVMETFKLASKITAKHLLNKLQGKRLAPNRSEVGARVRAAVEAESAQSEPEPLPEAGPAALPPPINPFAAEEPFGEATAPPDESDYEKVEEVSLEELLEGRERPVTFAGDVPVPQTAGNDGSSDAEAVEELDPEEIEELGEEELEEAAEEPLEAAGHPVEGATSDAASTDGDRTRALEERISQLESRLDSLSATLRDLGHRLGGLP